MTGRGQGVARYSTPEQTTRPGEQDTLTRVEQVVAESASYSLPLRRQRPRARPHADRLRVESEQDHGLPPVGRHGEVRPDREEPRNGKIPPRSETARARNKGSGLTNTAQRGAPLSRGDVAPLE